MTDADERLDALIDELHAPVVVCGVEFDASRILRELDPIAYRCAVADFTSFDEEE